MRQANYQIIDGRDYDKPLRIRDVGPWDKYLTVTNAAEDVVEYLVAENYLPPGRKLFYYDSENQLDEILVEDGRFAGFKYVVK